MLSLKYMAMYVQGSNETMAVTEKIKQECMASTEDGFSVWPCYRIEVMSVTPQKHTWFSNTQKPTQTPAETLRRNRGNCVDKAILMAELFKELNFEPVYLVAQNYHACVMVADETGIHYIDCVPEIPIRGIYRIYSAGLG